MFASNAASNAEEEPMKLVPHEPIDEGGHFPPTLPAPEQPKKDEVTKYDGQSSPPATATHTGSPVASSAQLSAPPSPFGMPENMESTIAGVAPAPAPSLLEVDNISKQLDASGNLTTTISASITTALEPTASQPLTSSQAAGSDYDDGRSMPCPRNVGGGNGGGEASKPYYDDPVAHYTDDPRQEFPDYPTAGIPVPLSIPFTAMKVGDGGRNEVGGRDVGVMEEGLGVVLTDREWRPARGMGERDLDASSYMKLVGAVLGVCGTIGVVTAGTIYLL